MTSTEPTHQSGAVVRIRRIYEEVLPGDGARILVDRLWPRGISKERAHLDEWCKDIAPSTELRTWYAHVPERFAEFTERYLQELKDPVHVAALRQLRSRLDLGPLTLLTATKIVETSEAAVIARQLEASAAQSR